MSEDTAFATTLWRDWRVGQRGLNMKNTFITTCIGSVAAAAALASAPASAMDILARVISSTPAVQQVAVPRQVCSNEAVVVQAPRSGAGALVGAIAGGAVGNAIGNGGGRAAATMIGLVGGAVLGDRIEGPNTQLQNIQNCTTQTYYENRTSHFNVVYEYQGTQYTAQMPSDPGLHVRLNVSPVGAIEAAPQPFQSSQPGYYPQAQVQVQPQPVYVQQVVTAPAPYPVYYPQPYYSPYYPPIGLSLNFGYSRGFGGGHRGHWR